VLWSMDDLWGSASTPGLARIRIAGCAATETNEVGRVVGADTVSSRWRTPPHGDACILALVHVIGDRDRGYGVAVAIATSDRRLRFAARPRRNVCTASKAQRGVFRFKRRLNSMATGGAARRFSTSGQQPATFTGGYRYGFAEVALAAVGHV